MKKYFSSFEHCPVIQQPVQLSAAKVTAPGGTVVLKEKWCSNASRCTVLLGDLGQVEHCLLHPLA
jgi:hypothetical protein